jgi:hypothetical protein
VRAWLRVTIADVPPHALLPGPGSGQAIPAHDNALTQF